LSRARRHRPDQPRLTERLQTELLGHLANDGEPAPEQRIFVNRTLRMESVRCVGFDLDWTLADYERLPFERLMFDLAIERLIDHHGHPAAVRELEFRPAFPQRGLLIDKQAGTVLRMSRHRFVNLAYFGRERLHRDELKRLYRYEPIQPASGRFYHIDSLFELPETNLFAELIEASKRLPQLAERGYPRLFEDVRGAIDWVHAEGTLKSRVLADTDTYLRRDKLLALALLRLRLGGRPLILLTNSNWEYASGLCSFLFDGLLPGLDSWRQLFDLVIVEAGKPDFFRHDRPFTALDPGGEPTGETDVPDWDGAYRGGCLDGLMKRLDLPGEQVLYVGDHIYGDAVTSKQESTWRIALIVRELEAELRARLDLGEKGRRHVELMRKLATLGHELDHVRDEVSLGQALAENGADIEAKDLEAWRHRFAAVRRRHVRGLKKLAQSSEQLDAAYHPYWGSLFKQGTSKTRFAGQLDSYACLYTARARNFAFYGSQHYYRVARDPMMHELEGPGSAADSSPS
jgi:HAD superfamily 5'-nucleotidase-like hydrolase